MYIQNKGELCCGTIDSWLVYKLTGGKEFRTDYSNASRTQMFNISELKWDKQVCDLFGIPTSALLEVTDSDGDYGVTDFGGYLDREIPIRGVLGDSHGALFLLLAKQSSLPKSLTLQINSIWYLHLPVLALHTGTVKRQAFSQA
ncbi:FGGY family carbohydrate kinase [Blautia luti]|uniref:FGGY family carbohydrate kinase n=1 Tax=Blautia luti TaxID=89014 RepID=UPI002ED6401B